MSVYLSGGAVGKTMGRGVCGGGREGVCGNFLLSAQFYSECKAVLENSVLKIMNSN